MTIQGIANNVQALLAASDRFVTVLPHPPSDDSDFAGFPSACHYYVDAESNYATVSQNRRVYQYRVELYLVTNAETTEKTEFEEAYELIDAVMQMFDQSIDLSEGLGKTLDPVLTPACDIMRPTPSTLERINTIKGDGLMMVIDLYCEADITFRNS